MKPAPNAPEQIAAFIRAIYEPGDWIEIRPLPSARSVWRQAGDSDQIVGTCLRLNRSQENIYFGVHPRIASGRRGNKGVALARCVWADFDGKHLQATTPAEQISEVRQRIADAWLPEPTIIVFSGHGVHAYWRFTAPVTELDPWDMLIDCLITTIGSDGGAKGRDRIMRTPGLVNWKAPVALAELIECDPDRRAGWDDIASCAYHANLPEPPATESVEQAVTEHAQKRNCYGFDDRESVIDRFNAVVPIADLLTSAGYDVVGHHFRRPGKTDRGFSGIIRGDKHGKLVSAHWSSNDRLNDQRFGGRTCGIHDSFSAFAHLEHGGDVPNAVKAASDILGMRIRRRKGWAA